MTTANVRKLALNTLRIAPENARKTAASAASHDELKASIRAHGVMPNLSAYDGKDGFFYVYAGGRRLCHRRARRPPRSHSPHQPCLDIRGGHAGARSLLSRPDIIRAKAQRKAREPRQADVSRHEKALRLLASAKPFHGSPAQRYLRNRDVERFGTAIKFHKISYATDEKLIISNN